MFREKLTLMLVGCAIFAVTQKPTQSYAQTGMEIVSEGGNSFTGTWTLGYEFTPSTDIVISTLAFYDRGGDGLIEDHDVAIWDLSGNILSSTTVVDSDPLDGLFRHSSVAPLMLNAGETYVIGGHDFSDDPAIATWWPGVATNPGSEIALGDGRWMGGGSLSFPGNVVGLGYYPVVSFNYTVAIPEPSSPVLLFGIAMLLVRRRRRE